MWPKEPGKNGDILWINNDGKPEWRKPQMSKPKIYYNNPRTMFDTQEDAALEYPKFITEYILLSDYEELQKQLEKAMKALELSLYYIDGVFNEEIRNKIREILK